MKNALLKFAGLFVEKVPVDEHGNPLPKGARGQTGAAPAGSQQQQQPPAALQPQHQPGAAPQMPPAAPPAAYPGHAAPHQMQPQQPVYQQPQQPQQAPQQPQQTYPQSAGAQQPLSIALRAWVPEEYASHLAPFGLHVIAAGGSVTSEQARAYGAGVLVISAECLGQDLHLLTTPQLPTVFIAPQTVMIPDVAGVVQVQEPLRASEVATAAREATAAWAAAHR